MKELGPYVIEAELGRGAMGVVYRARHGALNRAVALKVLKPGLAADVEFTARFEREIRGGARVQHPHVVRVLDAGRVDQTQYLAMELVEGESLGDLLQRAGRLPWPLALAVISRVLDGLSHLHGLSILHRDIKLANVLIGADASVRITDFGLATYEGATVLTRTGHVVGTLAFMAPELFRNDAATPQSDVWAAGICLYLLITGGFPISPDPLADYVARLMSGAIPAPETRGSPVPPEVSRFALRLLERDPAQRPADARALHEQC